MTDASYEPKSSSAQQIEIRAAEWLDRRTLWDWNDEKQEHLDAWLGENTAHLVTYLRLEAVWARAERLTALRQPPRVIKAARPFAPYWIGAAKIAAGIVVLAAIGIVGFRLEQADRGKTFATPVGGRETLAFSDGSQIELNTNTVLHTEIGQEKRTATLEQGEAYFQIKHDQNRPFIVMAGSSRLIDLGTKFVVRREKDRLVVTLIDGRVHLETGADAGSRQITMAPGETAVATAEGLVVTRKAPTELADKLAWRKGLLVFQHTTLADAAAEFNRYNDRKIIVGDAVTSQLTINGTFPANDVGPFVEVTGAVFGLRAEKNSNEIVLKH